MVQCIDDIKFTDEGLTIAEVAQTAEDMKARGELSPEDGYIGVELMSDALKGNVTYDDTVHFMSVFEVKPLLSQSLLDELNRSKVTFKDVPEGQCTGNALETVFNKTVSGGWGRGQETN